MPKRIICRAVTGPTASGKSALAMKIATEMGWEIICMDSMQVYRGMDIGTAKPDAHDRKRVVHHLLDIRDPSDSFSVSDYVEEAEKKIADLAERKKDFLFVGGTGLYLQALMHPMGMGGVPANERLRSELNSLALETNGKEILHQRLRAHDPETAARLPPNDIRRMIRAIEVYEMTGIPFSSQQNRNHDPGYEWKVISTALERPVLYRRINDRVDRMIAQGLPDEVDGLLRSGVSEKAQSMQAIGYKEMIPYVKGVCGIETVSENIRTCTRRYAKRQMTFLRRESNIQYIDMTHTDTVEKAIEYLR